MKLITSILLLVFCCAATAFGEENTLAEKKNAEEKTIALPEACPESDDCPVDQHAIGTPCPHKPNYKSR